MKTATRVERARLAEAIAHAVAMIDRAVTLSPAASTGPGGDHLALDGTDVAAWYWSDSGGDIDESRCRYPVYGPHPTLVTYLLPDAFHVESGVVSNPAPGTALAVLMVPDERAIHMVPLGVTEWRRPGGVPRLGFAADPSGVGNAVVSLSTDEDGRVVEGGTWTVTGTDGQPVEDKGVRSAAIAVATVGLLTMVAHSRQPEAMTVRPGNRVLLPDPGVLRPASELALRVPAGRLVGEAVSAHAEALDWTRSGHAARWAEQIGEGGDARGWFLRACVDTVERGATWAVGEQALGLAMRASESVPASAALDPESVPMPAGFVFFAAVAHGVRGGGARALSWRTGAETLDVIVWMTPRDTDPGARWPDLDGLPQGLRPVEVNRWWLGASLEGGGPDGSEREEAWARAWAVRVLVSLWAMTDGSVLEGRDEPVDRAERRRVGRRHRELGERLAAGTRVVSLPRRVRGPREDGGPSGRSLRVRVLVGAATGGFWRSQPYGPLRSFRRRVWVAPFWRGPEDGPVKSPDRVVFSVSDESR